jgi:Uma2 family endonuclease
MVDHTQIRMTAAEFFALPESNLPRQLLNGEVIELGSPELEHQDVVLSLGIIFRQAAKTLGRKAYVAPVDVYFDEENVPQPDVIWLAPNSPCVPEGSKRLNGAPDLIAEVLSPSTQLYDRRTKFRLYQKYGVREYWLVDPRNRLVEVWQHNDGVFVRLDVYGEGETFTSALIGNIEVNLIFAG